MGTILEENVMTTMELIKTRKSIRTFDTKKGKLAGKQKRNKKTIHT